MILKCSDGGGWERKGRFWDFGMVLERDILDQLGKIKDFSVDFDRKDQKLPKAPNFLWILNVWKRKM